MGCNRVEIIGIIKKQSFLKVLSLLKDNKKINILYKKEELRR